MENLAELLREGRAGGSHTLRDDHLVEDVRSRYSLDLNSWFITTTHTHTHTRTHAHTHTHTHTQAKELRDKYMEKPEAQARAAVEGLVACKQAIETAKLEVKTHNTYLVSVP